MHEQVSVAMPKAKVTLAASGGVAAVYSTAVPLLALEFAFARYVLFLYGVATISRLFKIIGRFCKRAL